MKTLNTYITEWKANTTTVSSIKKKQYFIYELQINKRIKIFDVDWPQFFLYRSKVYINDEHIELNDHGRTKKEYDPGTYKVEIKDIDNVTNCNNMFFGCKQLVKVPLFDTHKVKNMNLMFSYCENLKEVPLFDTSMVEYMVQMFYNCEQLISVPLFNTSKIKGMGGMFYRCERLNEQTKQEWSKIYDFEKNNKKQ